ncbi:putative enzyme [gamma proteobacterium IMCC2047]|nr:putative enzyme [gamma proteobacterium IMCC2047]
MGVIYISGYGRSGSTYLDLLLGQHSAIASGGEVVNLTSLLAKGGGKCSCGYVFKECPVWGGIIKETSDRVRLKETSWQQLNNASRVRDIFGSYFLFKLWKTISFDRNRCSEEQCSIYNRSLFALNKKNQDANFIIDSSKTSYSSLFRPFILSRDLDEPVIMVHLVRHPYSVIASIKKGTNKALASGDKKQRKFKVLRGFIGWMIANTAALLNDKLVKEPSVVIHYESLINKPKEEITKITALLGLKPDEIIEFLDGQKAQLPAHLCEGNRMGKGELKIAGNASVPIPTLKEKVYYFIFCSWLQLLLKRKCG